MITMKFSCAITCFQQDGKYKGAPCVHMVAGVWLDGYSDHLPTIIYMRKQ